MVDTSAGNTSYTENDPATPIDSALTVADSDPGATIVGATVQITGGYAGAQDILALAGSHPGISPSLSGDTLTLSGNASPSAYQAALRDVTYQNSSESPSTAPRTITFTVTDETARSGSDTKGLTVVAVDDPPVAVNDSATVLEDAAATAITVLTNDTDIDGGPKSVASITQPANGTVVITGGGNGLTYQPNPNYCNSPPGTTPDTFTYSLNGGSTATVSVTVTCVNDPPVADDETFSGTNSAIGNTTLVVNDPSDGAPTATGPAKSISGDILDGDADVDGPGPLVIVAGTIATNDGGSVTIEADGDFTFHPKAGTSCTDHSDSFNYTVSDQASPTPGTDTGQVTIEIQDCVWYVDDSAAGGGDGRSHLPFNALTSLNGAGGSGDVDGTGDIIFVYSGTYSGGLALEASQKLFGQPHGLTVGGVSLVAAGGSNPTVNGGVTIANSVQILGVDFGTSAATASLGGSGTGVTVGGVAGDSVSVNNPSSSALQFASATSGTMTFASVSGASGATSILLSGVDADISIAAGALTSTGRGVDIDGGLGDFSFAGTMSNAGAFAVEITNRTGAGAGPITFSGAITNTGQGINLDNNDTEPRSTFQTAALDDFATSVLERPTAAL